MSGRPQARTSHLRSTELWMQGEAAEREGLPKKAVQLFVQAAIAEEDADQPLRARVLWERIADKVGLTASLLERLAAVNERARFFGDAYDLWRAAAVRLHAEGREPHAIQARDRARAIKQKAVLPKSSPLALKALEGFSQAFVAELDA